MPLNSIFGIIPPQGYPLRNAISINILNSQSIATPAPFQTLLTFTPYVYGLRGDLGNVRFYDANFNPLFAWLESGSAGTLSNIWVKLPNGIPANSSVTIYMFVLPQSITFDGYYWGEAPQLSPTYGQYDNGTSVFKYYTNFAGTSLPSGWTSYTSVGSVTVNNGVLIKGGTSASGGENGIAYQVSSGIGSPPYIVDYAPQQTTSPSGDSWAWNMAGLSNGLGSSYGSPNGGSNYLLADFEYGTQAKIMTSYSGTITNGALSTPSNNTFYGIFTQVITSSNYYTYYNYTQSTGQATGITLGTTSLPFEIMVGNNEATYAPNGQLVQWFRIRAYPPNGVMPSVSIGNL